MSPAIRGKNGFVLVLLELDRKSIVFHLQTIAFIVFLSISREPFWLGAFSPGVVETLYILERILYTVRPQTMNTSSNHELRHKNGLSGHSNPAPARIGIAN